MDRYRGDLAFARDKDGITALLHLLVKLPFSFRSGTYYSEIKSVVFVGFGSECKLSTDQVYEIAHELKLSGLPFLWALRKPTWTVDEDDALPPEFRTRNKGQGVVCLGWASQMEILAQPSVGGSLFHSGLGSIIETRQFGHTLVVLPIVIDQALNDRLLVEKGLAVEVERGEDRSFDRKGITKALRKSMVDEEGEGVRVRAREMRTIFGDHGLHQAYMDGFIQYLKKKDQKEETR
ncbi:soyasaponin III rhamnosyltransferase-like [Macadamia integrifolia]|uniref:soyasaponin III rhamnosyltransferase-like n=1 Tax=Macadamia integrifolia TaxID=60698 RepID=UPI001C4FAFFC|nr:soyasaponin III rhamnosyltransferase-like [Macadamia integrifolia]